MEDRNFLDYFWRLGVGNPSTRRVAVQSLVNSLKKTMTSDDRKDNTLGVSDSTAEGLETETTRHEKQQRGRERGKKVWECNDFQFKLRKAGSSFNQAFLNGLEYTTNRLVHGLCSGREGVRQGSAAALTALLVNFPKAIPLSSVVDAVHETTRLSKQVTQAEHKDLLLGRIFGYSALQLAGYFKSNGCLSLLETVMEDLVEVLDRKAYLQDAAAFALATIIIDVDGHNPGIAIRFVTHRLSSVFDASVRSRLQSSIVHASEQPQLGSHAGPSKESRIVAPFGLLGLYLKLHQHLIRNSNTQSSNGIDTKHQLWVAVSRNPLNHSTMRETALLILTHPSTIAGLHPKIANAWHDLFSLLVHSANQENRKQLFESLLQNINNRFFSTSTSSEPASGSTLQRVFHGFRLMIQILVILKVESLRQTPAPDLEELLHLYWSQSSGFTRQLAFHCRAASPTPLRAASQKCLELLSQIVHGISASRLLFKERRKKKNTSATIDVMTAGIYSLVDLSLIQKKTQDHDVGDGNDVLMKPLDTLYCSSMPVAERVWIRAATEFREGSSFALLHSGSLVSLVDLFFRSLSYDGCATLIESLLRSVLESDCSNAILKSLWNFDLLSQLLLFKAPASLSSSASMSSNSSCMVRTVFHPQAWIVLQVLASLLVGLDPEDPTHDPVVPSLSTNIRTVGLCLLEGSSDPRSIVPLVVSAREMSPLAIRKRLLHRVGPALNYVFHHEIHGLVKLLTELLNRPRDVILDKFKQSWNFVCASLSRFALDFMDSILTGLSKMMVPSEEAIYPPSFKKDVKFFSNSQKHHATARETYSPISLKTLNPGWDEGSVLLCPYHHLSRDDIQTCIMFGSLNCHLMVKILNLLSSMDVCRLLDDTSSVFHHAETIGLILEMLLCTLCFSSFLFVPLLTGGRTSPKNRTVCQKDRPTNLNDDADSTTDEDVHEQQVDDNDDWDDEAKADCQAAVDLMKQFGFSSCLGAISALGFCDTGNKFNIDSIDAVKLVEVLQGIADVLPTVVLLVDSPTSLPASHPDPYEPSKGDLTVTGSISRSGKNVSRAFTNSILISLWTSIGRHTSTASMDVLIEQTFELESDARMSTSLNGQDETQEFDRDDPVDGCADHRTNEDEEDEDEENEDEDEEDEDEDEDEEDEDEKDGDDDDEKAETDGRQTDTTNTTTRGEGEISHGNSDEEDEKDGLDEEIDDASLFGLLLDDKTLTEENAGVMPDSDGAADVIRSRMLKQQQLKQKQHLRRVKVQARFRALQLIQSALEGKLLTLSMVLSRNGSRVTTSHQPTASSISVPASLSHTEQSTSRRDDGNWIASVLQQLTWMSRLYGALNSLTRQQARRRDENQPPRGQSAMKKHEVRLLHSDLLKRGETLVEAQCRRLLLTLIKLQACPGGDVGGKGMKDDDGITTSFQVLRKLALTIANGLTQSSRSSSKSFVKETAKYQELGALLLLCIGLVEDRLLSIDPTSKHALRRFKATTAQLTFTLPRYCPKLQQQQLQQPMVGTDGVMAGQQRPREERQSLTISDTPGSLEETMGVMISSGLIMTDVLTALAFTWTRRSHPQLTERFFRFLMSRGKRLSMNIPFGLLFVPFSLAAIESPKVFVCRELLVIDRACRQLSLQAVHSQPGHRLAHTALGQRLFTHLAMWNSKLMVSIPHYENWKPLLSIISRTEEAEEAVTERVIPSPVPSGVSLLVHQTVLGWLCCRQAMEALTKNSNHNSSNDSASSKVLSDEAKDLEDATTTTTAHCESVTAEKKTKKKNNKRVDSTTKEEALDAVNMRMSVSTTGTSKETALVSAVSPVSCQDLQSVQKAAKVMFGQQLVNSMGRYRNVLETLLEHATKKSSTVNFSSSEEFEIRSLLETPLPAGKFTHRRKRRRQEPK